MTRRKEIKKKALSKYPQGTNRYNKFIEGAKWADKTMIEKATQWLFENVYDYTNHEDQERVEAFRKYLED